MEESSIRKNLQTVETEIAAACDRAGRKRDAVHLIAVSKTKPVSMIQECYAAGIRDFGENKVQELTEKYEQLPKDIRWHMIGHLQTNKVKYIVDKVYMIHSVDSLKLAEEISRQAVKHQVKVNILIEVNASGEESKFGVSLSEAPELIRQIALLPGICVKGLMTVAPYVENAEENRQYFVNMRQLCVDIQEENIDNVNVDMLSMGMTGDYTVAIEEGAAFVRVGTGIFGERDYSV